MDLHQIMRELHYGAEHFTNEERAFFDKVMNGFRKNGAILQADAPHVLTLYKKLKFLQINPAQVVAGLEANMLLLSTDEQAAVEGARYTLEYGSTLDMVTLEKLLGIGKALAERQHSALVSKGEPILAAVPARIQPQKTSLPPPAQPTPKRPSALRPAPLKPIPALEAAMKLLKGR